MASNDSQSHVDSDYVKPWLCGPRKARKPCVKTCPFRPRAVVLVYCVSVFGHTSC